MKMEEFEELIRNNLKATLGGVIGGDGVTDELAVRSAAGIVALLNIIEIEERCPVCDCCIPDNIDGESLNEAVLASMKQTIDTRVSIEGIGVTTANIIYFLLGELSRNTSMALIGYLMEQRSKP